MKKGREGTPHTIAHAICPTSHAPHPEVRSVGLLGVPSGDDRGSGCARASRINSRLRARVAVRAPAGSAPHTRGSACAAVPRVLAEAEAAGASSRSSQYGKKARSMPPRQRLSLRSQSSSRARGVTSDQFLTWTTGRQRHSSWVLGEWSTSGTAPPSSASQSRWFCAPLPRGEKTKRALRM
eukprot:2704590-Prymnesium_polylepis.1